jgi:A/G-specific adenine glycosylase
MLDTRLHSSLRRRLLVWFERQRRDLPWRIDRDPYRIWVSEVMLQQTTVATVASRFDRFLRMFPTVAELARADEQDVLRAWEGLGYYRRARHLHQAARSLLEHGNGELPDDPKVWAKLPGVGRYILGAIMSQAFGRRFPIVEANSKRVLSRLFAWMGDPNSRETSDWLWRTAEAILPRKRIGDFNQAVMELGALICGPTAPACERCPVSSICAARKNGLQNSIPTKAAPVRVEEVREAAVVVRKGREVLLVRRPETGRWANMWEFPHAPMRNKEPVEDTARRLIVEALGISADLGAELLTVRHAVTRFRITMVCLEAKYRSGSYASTYYKEGRWVDPKELGVFPVSTPQRKLAHELSKSRRQLRLF